MEISLTHFLNINFLIMTLFPYGRMFLQKGINKFEGFAKSFCTTAGFVIGYLFFCMPVFINKFFIFPFSKDIKLILTGSFISLFIEFGLFFIKYKKLRIIVIRNGSVFHILMMLLIIPILEEVIYILCLHTICQSLSIPDFIFIILSGFSFGLSHFIYHKINIVTKTIWGLVFAIIYIQTGCVYIVIISHIVNNLILFFLGKTEKFGA